MQVSDMPKPFRKLGPSGRRDAFQADRYGYGERMRRQERALAGATVGAARIPESWIHGIVDWPRSASLLRAVADRLADQLRRGHPLGEVSYPWPAVLPRNLFFLLLVLLHAFRRLAPPY